MSPDEAPAVPTPVQRSASTARRERRDRCSYLAGERAGRLAGLKEAAKIAGRHREARLAARDAAKATKSPKTAHDHESMAFEAAHIEAAVRARISEIEGEAG